jgi:hypothetical protein
MLVSTGYSSSTQDYCTRFEVRDHRGSPAAGVVPALILLQYTSEAGYGAFQTVGRAAAWGMTDSLAK